MTNCNPICLFPTSYSQLFHLLQLCHTNTLTVLVLGVLAPVHFSLADGGQWHGDHFQQCCLHATGPGFIHLMLGTTWFMSEPGQPTSVVSTRFTGGNPCWCASGVWYIIQFLIQKYFHSTNSYPHITEEIGISKVVWKEFFSFLEFSKTKKKKRKRKKSYSISHMSPYI